MDHRARMVPHIIARPGVSSGSTLHHWQATQQRTRLLPGSKHKQPALNG